LIRADSDLILLQIIFLMYRNLLALSWIECFRFCSHS